MGLLDQVFQPMSLRSAAPGSSVGGFPFFGVTTTKSGAKVNRHSAMSLGAFFNAVDLCSNDIAKLPKAVFQKDGDKLTKLTDHPVHHLISDEPNAYVTPFTFWKYLAFSAIVKKDGYAYISRDASTGRPVALKHLDADFVTPFKGEDKMYYRYKGQMIDGDDMIHIYFWTDNGYSGMNVIQYAANALGVALDGQNFVGNNFRGVSAGVMETDNAVDTTNKQKLESGFKAKMSAEGEHKVALLDDGFKYKSITLTPAEAQWLETDSRSVIAICQFLNIAPHKLKMLDKANYSNLQLMTIEHQQDSVMPRTVLIEQELKRKLFTKAEQKTQYVKFNLRSMLAGDQKSEAEYLTKLVSWGIMDRNEAREKLELNPVDGLSEPLTPVNMQLLQQLVEQQNNTGNE